MNVALNSRCDESSKLSGSKAVEFVLQEARMILPGIQALFGFQLIAVFQSVFQEKLTPLDKNIHLFAIVLTMVAVGLLMAPAAYDRQCRLSAGSQKFLKLSTWLVTAGMVPLMLSMSLDFYIIAKIIIHNHILAGLGAFTSLLFFTFLWFCFPRMDGVSQNEY